VTQAKAWVNQWKSLGDPVENVGSPKVRNGGSDCVCNKRVESGGAAPSKVNGRVNSEL
jgi:hypothetical protein